MTKGGRRGGERRITIADLAAELNLSKSAVSNALSGAKGVSDETRARVQQAADRHGWRPNALARALSTGRADAVGVCLAREPEALSDSYYSGVLVGLESVFADSPYSLLLRISTRGADLDVYRQWAAEHRVDGVVLFDTQPDDPRSSALADLGLPFVLQGDLPGEHQHPVVGFLTDHDASLVAGHLAARGYQRVMHLGGPEHMYHERLRHQVLTAHLDRVGLAHRHAWDCYGEQGGRDAARDLLADGWADAVVCSEDTTAVGVLDSYEPGEPRPGIISWDDSLMCRVVRPRLTAIHRDSVLIGRACARAMLRMLDEGSIASEALSSALVVRDSTPQR